MVNRKINISQKQIKIKITNMAKFLVDLLEGMRDTLNGVSNTVWGIVILFISMHMIAHGQDVESAYYFAGVASTLIGIKQPVATSFVATGRTQNISEEKITKEV